jgi:hypothetical protein
MDAGRLYTQRVELGWLGHICSELLRSTRQDGSGIDARAKETCQYKPTFTDTLSRESGVSIAKAIKITCDLE